MANILRRPSKQELFSRDLRKAMGRCTANQQMLALLIVEIGQLDKIEGTLGYKAGQAVAQRLVARVERSLRDSDQIIRVGERKFWVVLSNVQNEGHAVLAAQKITRIAQKRFSVEGRSVKISTAIGVALHPEHASEPEDLVRRANLALADGMESKTPFKVYSADSTREMSSVWKMESELERALEDSEFEVYFQPKINLRNLTPCGGEALIRWHHPDRGMIAPDLFLPVAERAGKLEAITSFVLNAALRQRADWPERFANLPVAINMPPNLLLSGQTGDLIASSLKIWGCPPSGLIVEVTEDSFANERSAVFNALRNLRETGVKVSIDDFGTGYSSLAYFKDMPADELKIDKSFIMKLQDKSGEHHIVRAIISLARKFEFSVVAEGVETRVALKMLREMRCDIAQGYFYSPALPQREFIEWLGDFDGVKHYRATRPTAPATA